MKLSLIILSLLFLASCQQYRYDITYEKCNGSTGSIVTTIEGDYKLDGEFHQIYRIHDLGGRVYLNINNVCDFSFTKTPIK